MRYKRYALGLSLILSFSLLVQADSWPIVRGNFIQEWLSKSWSAEKWDLELAYLKEVGIEYIIISPTAFGREEGHALRTLYPTKVEGWSEYFPDFDLLENTLSAAKRADMKVILGLNMNDLWWKKGVTNPQWFYKEVELGNKLAEEIYNTYFPRYKDTICAWYFVWEIDNLMAREKGVTQVIVNAFNKQIDYLNQLDPNLFFIWSPYMNSWQATKEEYRDFWIEVFKEVHFREGDVFSPMDCVGAGGTNLDNVAGWFAEFRKAVDTKPGLKLWSNAENFDYRDWTSAPIGRFVEQLKSVAEYVDDFITFSYSHYYSPNIIDSGFHTTYLEYVKTGLLDTQPPIPPTNIEFIDMLNGEIFLRWDPGEDNIGVAGYIIYRNGRKIGKTQVSKKSDLNLYLNAYKEGKLRSGRNYTYTIVSYDFAGNMSVPSDEYVLCFE